MSFFDAIALTPMDEMNIAFSRVDSNGYDGVLSIRGRGACVLRTITHVLGIPLKSLYYIGYYLLSDLSMRLIRIFPIDALDNDRVMAPNEVRGIRVLIDNPELLDRFRREIRAMPLCAIISPLSQTIQALKSVLGIIYPGFYYQTDPFYSIFRCLTEVAKNVKCSAELIDCLDRGSDIIHEKFKFGVYNKDYYYELFKKDLQYICDSFKANESLPLSISNSQKLLLLNMLDPRGTDSGIKGCAPALGRLLQNICLHLMIPEDPIEAYERLSDQYKLEVVDQLVMIAEAVSHEICRTTGECTHDWENVINR